jgi:hypothetical protein
VGNIQSSSARRVASRHVGNESFRLRGGKICKASGNSSIHSTQAQSSAPPKVASQSLQEEASRSIGWKVLKKLFTEPESVPPKRNIYNII